jgi:membrane-associated phospholipid phosphatase
MALRRRDTLGWRLWRRATCLLVCAAWLVWAGRVAAAPDAKRTPAASARTEPVAGRKSDELTVTWRRFGVWDYLGTAVALGALLTVETTMDIPPRPHYTAPFPVLDVTTRHALVASTREDREQADKLSDLFWYFSTSLPVVDALVTPVVRGAPFDVIWQLELMNAQAFTLSSLLTRFQHRTVGRSRPNALGCKNDPNYDVQCGTLGQLASWPSGHTSISMTGAGLSCAHHLHARLYGNKAADIAACAGPIVTANLVSFFRLRADRHWASDNIAGTLIGFPIGYGLPTLLYYRPFWRSSPRTDARSTPNHLPRVAVAPMFFGDAAFVYAVGVM